jgi:AcrR family transcriptional regulator
MAPEERRRHITETARRLFAERPYTEVSTQDVADAAGVARSLVHHYFHGIKDVFLAVLASSGSALADQRTAGVETPFEERIASNVSALLDVAEQNRETWMAVLGQPAGHGDPEIQAVLDAVRERSVDRMLEANADLLTDTPRTRLLLRGFQEYSGLIIRSWLVGETPRDTVQFAIVRTGSALIRDVIPAVEAGARAGVSPPSADA